jgi:3-dehydroquinate synthase
VTQVVQVAGTGFRPYEVRVGRGLLADAGGQLADLVHGRTVIVADGNVVQSHARTVAGALTAAGVAVSIIPVPPGEASKSWRGLETLCDALLAQGLDRKDVILALGGGVVGDLAGLAAALYMRGVDFVQLPTSLLAQVDSSVGGKTAIDTAAGKNMIGAFHQPRRVLADIDALATLPARQLRSGWAEVLKHGLIRDAAYFDWLAGEGASGAAGDVAALEPAVVRSVEIKAAIVSEDEKEAGARALLNLGHTFGHALEAELGFDETVMTHGEAVALGCALAFRFSAAQGLCPADHAAAAERAFAAAGLPTRLVGYAPFDAGRLIARMAGDKKAEGGRLTLILARAIGDAFVQKDVDRDAVAAFLVGEGARLS